MGKSGDVGVSSMLRGDGKDGNSDSGYELPHGLRDGLFKWVWRGCRFIWVSYESSWSCFVMVKRMRKQR